MYVKTYELAKSQAKANAILTGRLWCVYFDTSGNLRVAWADAVKVPPVAIALPNGQLISPQDEEDQNDS